MLKHRITRRSFGKSVVGSVAALGGTPALLRGQNLNEKLNIAMIACGGRRGANLKAVGSENIVALCDVDYRAVEAAAAKFPNASRFTDFRKLFDRPDSFDAVVVSTCENTHAFATMLSLKHGKHVYCEKPLTHGIREARQIRLAAAKAKVATQIRDREHATGGGVDRRGRRWAGRGDMPAVKLTWHHGESKLEIWMAGDIPKWMARCSSATRACS
jgi:hypothetical protein